MHVGDGRLSIDFVDVEDICSSTVCTNCVGEVDVSMRVESIAAKSGKGKPTLPAQGHVHVVNWAVLPKDLP